MTREPVPALPAVLSVLDGRHELTVHAVEPGEDSVAVRYSVTPPLPDGEGTLLLLIVEARDDAGNTCDDGGGAYGTSEDGARTEGTVTVRPGLPSGAGMVRVRITFVRGGREYPYELALPGR
jgi:hypothetical protein